MIQIFDVLVQKEKKREFRTITHVFGESFSMNINVRGGSSVGRNFRTNYASNSYNRGDRTQPFDDQYKRLGHTKYKY